MVKRAITLGGGGPAAGLHIGVLEALAEDERLRKGRRAISLMYGRCLASALGLALFTINSTKKQSKKRIKAGPN